MRPILISKQISERATTSLASAQGRGGALQRLFQQPSVLALLEKVQKDLKLTDDQTKKIAEAGEKMREKAMEAFPQLQGLSREELEKKARSLKGATMPDGSIHP